MVTIAWLEDFLVWPQDLAKPGPRALLGPSRRGGTWRGIEPPQRLAMMALLAYYRTILKSQAEVALDAIQDDRAKCRPTPAREAQSANLSMLCRVVLDTEHR
jgi:hypothetical protein